MPVQRQPLLGELGECRRRRGRVVDCGVVPTNCSEMAEQRLVRCMYIKGTLYASCPRGMMPCGFALYSRSSASTKTKFGRGAAAVAVATAAANME